MMRRLLNNWPVKLGALAVGVLAWYFVTLGDDTVGQNTLFVPVSVVGLADEQIPVGVPESVTVVVSGRSARVNRLRPENFDAVLDLGGVTGAFSQEIEIVAPQDVNVLSVTPAEASGTVEVITSRTVPVQVALLGVPPPDLRLELTFDPAEAQVSGRGTTLARVAAVRATVLPQPGEQEPPLYPIDDAGRPVMDITVRPQTLQVALLGEPVLHQKEILLEIELPDIAPLTLLELEPAARPLQVAGPQAALEPLTAAVGVVLEPTGGWREAEYTLPVSPALPEGVAALETPYVRLRLAQSGPDAGQNASQTTDGETDDLSSSPLRGPDAPQDGQSGE
jgi:YbbR domain-containing protein